MKKLIVSEWMSLDGVVDASSMEQWFNPYHSDSRGKYIQDIIHDCDAMLYGRITYEMLHGYWSMMQNNEMGVAEKLNKVKKYVASAHLEEAKWENTTIIKQNIIQEIAALKKATSGNILVQGSTMLVKTLLQAGLVDELKLLINPHIMGTSGGRLFEDMNSSFELVNVQSLEKGVLAVSYKPVQAA
ncbi:dihydrofolate reductase family protein [Paraflavitalea soli]|nr:dihydrofolate reductase family protein [Paraflavitalea soli]